MLSVMGSGLVSPGHIIILLVILLLVFGAKRLPELGRGLGTGMREFKNSVTGDDSADERAEMTAAAQQPPPAPTPPPAAAAGESEQPSPTGSRSE